MKTRLAKFISDSGIASRREAEKLISSGKISVNGEIILTPVCFVDESDQVKIGNKLINHKSQIDTKLFAFHKPINTMTTTIDPDGRDTVYDVLPKKYKNLKYIGRLDYKTTGLLLMTNDGELSRKFTLPASGLKRIYDAKLHPKNFAEIQSGTVLRNLKKFLSPVFSDESIFDSVRRGIVLEGIKYAPMVVDVLSRYPLTVRLTLVEGKKNEIRTVFDALGFQVVKLHRISYGNIELGDLKVGEIRDVTREL